MLPKLTAALTGATLAACSVVGVREAEEPAFSVIARVGAVEVRQYAPRIAAETSVGGGEMEARSAGFRRLAGYIFGSNRSRAKIAMTAPVAQAPVVQAPVVQAPVVQAPVVQAPVVQSGESIAMTAPVAQARDGSGQWLIRFFMPAKYTMETLPQPLDPAVRLVPVPGETMAVLRFSGSTAPEAVKARGRELLRTLQGSAWQPTGTAVAWFYDPPWTLPPFRRNEVAAPVTRR